VSRGPQGHRFHPLVRPPQAAVTSAAHPQPRWPDRLRSGERKAQPSLLAIGLKRKVMLGVLLFLLNRLKLHQVFGDEHLAGKVFLHLLGPRRVIAVTLVRQVRQYHGLDIGACGHLPDFI